MTYRKPDGEWGWVVVFAAFTINVICDGLRFSYGLLYIEFLHEFQRGSGETSWIGSLLVGVSNMAGLGYVLMVLPLKIMIIQYFESRKTLAMGIAMCGCGVGTVLLNPLSKLLIDQYGWRGTLLIESALVLNCIICGWAMVPVRESMSTSEPVDGLTNVDPLVIIKETPVGIQEKNIQSEACDDHAIGMPQIRNDNSADKTLTPMHTGIYQEYECEEDTSSIPILTSKSASRDNGFRIETDVVETESESELSYAADKSYKDSETSLTLGNKTHTNVTDYDRKHEVVENKEIRVFSLILLRDGGFLIFMLSMFLIISSFMIPYSYLPDMAVAAGMSRTGAAGVMSSIGSASTVCWIVGGVIGDKKWFNRWKVYIAAILIAGFSMCVMPFATGHIYVLVLVCVVFGLCYGMVILSYSLVVADIFGEEHLTDALGLMLVGGGVASLVGPPMAGWLFDSTGTYLLSFIIAGTVFSLGGIVLFMVPWLHKK